MDNVTEDEVEIEEEITFRTVPTAEITDLAAFIETLDGKRPTVIVAPDGSRAFVLSEAAHERLLDKFEDLDDLLASAQAKLENEPTIPFEEVLREHMPERFTHVSD